MSGTRTPEKNKGTAASVEDFQHHIVCFVNSKSGGRDGAAAAEALRAAIGEDSVIDLMQFATCPASRYDEVAALIRAGVEASGKLLRVVVAGGDGSINWTHGILERMGFIPADVPPAVAVMPLGTGNELAARLGWGNAHSVKRNMFPYLTSVDRGQVVFVDNWMVDYSSGKVSEKNISQPSSSSSSSSSSKTTEPGTDAPAPPTPSEPPRDDDDGNGGDDDGCDNVGGARSQTMSCFLSVGYDAFIAHKFHKLREKKPKLAGTRAGNKLWHVWYGLGVIFKKQPVLNDLVELYVDGERVDFPKPVRCIHVLNIKTTGDGLDLFRSKHTPQKGDIIQDHAPQSYGDGKVEVVATFGPMHLVSMRLRRGKHALRLAQGSDVRLVLKESAHPRNAPGDAGAQQHYPMQVEGEPFLQLPGEIRVHSARHRFFVAGPKKPDQDPHHRRNSLAYPRLSAASDTEGTSTDEDATSSSAMTPEKPTRSRGATSDAAATTTAPSPLRPQNHDDPIDDDAENGV